jgi:hypothetical protein
MAESDKVDAKRCNTNHLILAALGGTFAVTVIITVISLALSPAHISFSITHASSKVISSNNGDNVNLMFIVAAWNPSRRCKAMYNGVFVSLKNSSAVGAIQIAATVNNGTAFQTGYIKGPNVTLINASAILPVSSADTTEAPISSSFFVTRLNGTRLTAVVRALVRFKVGVFRTRLFEMMVFCPGVLFLDEGSNSRAQLRNFTCSG